MFSEWSFDTSRLYTECKNDRQVQFDESLENNSLNVYTNYLSLSLSLSKIIIIKRSFCVLLGPRDYSIKCPRNPINSVFSTCRGIFPFCQSTLKVCKFKSISQVYIHISTSFLSFFFKMARYQQQKRVSTKCWAISGQP